jgi:hypothetical protein
MDLRQLAEASPDIMESLKVPRPPTGRPRKPPVPFEPWIDRYRARKRADYHRGKAKRMELAKKANSLNA